MAVIRNIVVKIGADISSLQKGLQDASKTLEKTGKNLTDIGGKLTAGLTVPIAAATAGLLKLGMDFDEAFDNIRVGTGATGEALNGLKDDFKAVYTSVPSDIQSVGEAIADLNTRTGLSGKPLQELSSQMLNLSRITGQDLNGMITNSTRLFGDWGVSANKTGGTMDYLFKVSQATGIGFNDLNAKLVQFGAPLRQMGFDIETSAAMLGKFEKEGVNTELVLGGLRVALGKMSKEGIKDTGAALAEISKRIKEAGSAGEANSIAIELFGARVGPDMAAAIREGRFELDDLVTALKGSGETINGVAFETMDFAEQLQIMKNKLAIALEPLGSSLMQALNGAMPAVEMFVDKITELINWFNSLDGSVKTTIAVILGIAAAIGPVISVIGLVTSGVATLLSTLSLLISPVALVIAAIGALIAVFVVLWNTNEGFKNAAISIWEAIKTAILQVISEISAWWSQYGAGILESATTVFNAVFTVISTVFSQIWESLKTFFSYVSPIWESLKQLFMSLWDVAVQLWKLLEPVFAGIGAIVVALYGIWVGVFNGIIQALGPFVNAIISAVNIIVSVIGLIIALLRGDWSAAWGFMKSIAISTWEVIKGVFLTIINFIKGFVDGIISFFKGLWYALVGGSIIPDIVIGALTWFNNMLSGIKSIVSNIVSAVKGAFNSIFNFIGTAVKNAWNWGRNLVNSIADGIKSGINSVGDAVKGVANKIKSFLGFSSPTKEGPGSESDKWIPNLFKMMNDSFKDEIPKLNAVLSTAMEPSMYNDALYSNILDNSSLNESNGKSTIIIELDGRAIAQKTVEHLPRVLRLKGAAQ